MAFALKVPGSSVGRGHVKALSVACDGRVARGFEIA